MLLPHTRPLHAPLLGQFALACVFAFLAHPLPGNPVISEFMASNGNSLADEDGDYSDWIELANPTRNPISLAGYSLTDNTSNSDKWVFPDVTLDSFGVLVVFASDKDRTDPAGPLHTNFKLSANGEYLGLFPPAGGTAVSEFAPAFPPQSTDLSYGRPLLVERDPLVAQGTTAAWHVPLSADPGTEWREQFFDDSTWQRSALGLGYASPDVRSAWPLDGNGGDVGPDANEATAVGAIGFALDSPPGIDKGSCLELDGSGALAVGYTEFGDQFTLAAWVRHEAAEDILAIAANSEGGSEPDGFRFFINSYQTGNGRLIFETGNGMIGSQARTDSFSVVPGQWQHIACVVDRSVPSVRLFVDGMDVTVDPTVLPDFNASGPWFIGQFVGGSFRYLGRLDEFAWWDRPLSIGELESLAAGILPADLGALPLLVETDLTEAMRDVHPGLYSRIAVPGPAPLDDWQFLEIRLFYDDGFSAWLNGSFLASHLAPVPPHWDSVATTDRPWGEARQPLVLRFLDLPKMGPAGNVLALHGLNSSASSEEFLLAPEVDAVTRFEYVDEPRTFREPTPGEHNHPVRGQGPAIADVGHSPVQPEAGGSAVVSAYVSTLSGSPASVELVARTMFGPSSVISMSPGAEPGRYEAVLSLSEVLPGQMVRYLIRARDGEDNESMHPPQLEIEDAPRYSGFVVGPLAETSVPALRWFVEDPAAALDPESGTRCSLEWNGDFYDNVFVRPRGQSSILLYGDKQSFKFDFNPGYRFRLDSGSRPVDEINILSTWIDKAVIRPVLGMNDFAETGGESSLAFPVVQVQNGDFYSLAVYVEQVDEDYIRRHGLDADGALYKAVDLSPLANAWDGIEKKSRLDEDRTDLEAFVAAIQPGQPSRSTALYDQVHLPSMVNYLAVLRVLFSRDHVQKNYYLYRDTKASGEWRIFPWDLDLTYGRGWDINCSCIDNDIITFGENGLLDPLYGSYAFGGFSNHLLDAVLSDPRAREMTMRRLRTVMDQLLQPPGTPIGERRYESIIDAWVSDLQPWADLDFARWGNPYGEEQDLATAIATLKTGFLDPRRSYLYVTNGMENGGMIPGAQDAGVLLEFGEADVSPLSGNSDEEYLVLENPNGTAVDISGWRLEGGVRFTFEPGTVIPSHDQLYVADRKEAFRSRAIPPSGGMNLLVVGNFSGNLADEGELVRLIDHTGRLVAESWVGPGLHHGWMLH